MAASDKHVTWGDNTTQIFGPGNYSSTAALQAQAFGTPSTGSFFGSSAPPGASTTGTTPAAPASTTSIFGTASSSSFFGSSGTPAPPPASSGSGLFGSTAQSPSAPLFPSFTSPGTAGPSAFGGGAFKTSGAFTASPSTSSLFGAPAPAPSFFGTQAPTPATAQPPAMPAYAAMQAHMQASVQQEDMRVRTKLERLMREYTGNLAIAPGEDAPSSKFVAVVYNDLTPQERQLQWLHSSSSGATGPLAMTTLMNQPRPPQISDRDWQVALAANPDPTRYVPQVLVGAQALEARKVWQQDRAKDHAKEATALQTNLDFVQQRHLLAKQKLDESIRKHVALRQRLLDVMKQVEIARCFNSPLQPDEVNAVRRLNALLEHVESARKALVALQDQTQGQLSKNHQSSGEAASSAGLTAETLTPDMAHRLLDILKEQRRKLETTSETAKTDIKDVNLIGTRVLTTATAVRY